MRAYDLTHILREDIPVFPGDGSPVLAPAATMAEAGYRTTRLAVDSHTGTHVDAPAHLLPEGAFLESLPPEAFGGWAVVLEASPAAGPLTPERVQAQLPGEPVDFILLSTGWEQQWGAPDYMGAYPVLLPETAAFLAGLGLKGLGMDTPGPDEVTSPDTPCHRLLLESGVLLLENLTGLGPLRGKRVFLTVSPLKFRHSDGAPARVIAWEGLRPE